MKKKKLVSMVIAFVMAVSTFAPFMPMTVSAATTHTVTFKHEDGTIISTEEVNDGEKVTRPTPEPKITGCKFIDWFQYSSGYSSTPFDFDSTQITSDITIVALFRNVFYINLDINGGNFTTDVEVGGYPYETIINRQNYEETSKNTSFIIPPTNKEFDHLEINGTKWTEDTYTITDDVTIKIIWKDKSGASTYAIVDGATTNDTPADPAKADPNKSPDTRESHTFVLSMLGIIAVAGMGLYVGKRQEN